MRKEYFVLKDSTTAEGYYMIAPKDYEELHLINTIGAFTIFPARLMNLSYAQYLRFCRDMVGGELRGKQGYPYVIFKDCKELRAFVRLLNVLAERAVFDHDHPDFEQTALKWKEMQEQ